MWFGEHQKKRATSFVKFKRRQNTPIAALFAVFIQRNTIHQTGRSGH